MIEAKLKEILLTVLELDPSENSDDLSTETNEKWDSIKHLLLMSTLEEEFQLNFSDDDLLSLTSYQSIKNRLEEANDA